MGNEVEVLIEQTSACSSCSVKMACATSEMQQKVVTASAQGVLAVGDSVIVYGEQRIGLRAVMLAFVFPLALALAALFAFSAMLSNEGIAALCSLAVLVPYYALLATQRDKISRQLRFSARHA